MWRSGLAAWSAVAALAAVGCGSSTMGYGGGTSAPAACTATTATPVTRSVELVGTAFVPSCARVARGTSVTFTNDDAAPHTVTSDPGQAETFDSGTLAQGAQFAHTFATAGTVRAHCALHPGMNLTVFVE